MENRPYSGVKRQCTRAMEIVTRLAESCEINEHALVQISKRLKSIHDADSTREKQIQRDVVLEYALREPATICFAPKSVATYGVTFVTLLVKQKRVSMDPKRHSLVGDALDEAVALDTARMSDWTRRLIDFYVGDGACESNARSAIELLLQVDASLFEEPLLVHLQQELLIGADELYEDREDELDLILCMAPLLAKWATANSESDDDSDVDAPKD